MDGFWTGFEKRAGRVSQWLKKIPLVEKYIQQANSPAFKLKKAVGKGLLVAGGAGYGLHQMTKEPELARPEQ